MSGHTDPTTFPLREGVVVPRDMVAMHTATLERTHGVSLRALAGHGGISVYELLLLQPVPSDMDRARFERDIFDLTVPGALRRLHGAIEAFMKQREADAEAAMLAMMEAEADAGAAPVDGSAQPV